MEQLKARGGRADLKNPLFERMRLASSRTKTPAAPDAPPLPGLRVVSADNHCEITEDIFYDAFPAAMKARAPRVKFDRVWRIDFPGHEPPPMLSARVGEMIDRLLVPSCFDPGVRLAHMEAEGIDSEIVFPQSLFGSLRHKDLEVRELMYRIYNDYVARLGREASGRFYGVGVFSNWWDPARAEPAMRQILDLGLKTFMIPTAVRDAAGRDVSLASPDLDRFWSVVEEAGLPLNFHIGEDFSVDGPGGHAAYFMTTTSPFRKPLAQLMFGGVFDRHPGLRIVFSEAGINWVASYLQDAELYYETYGDVAGCDPKRSPTDYWRDQCYATFQLDQLGLEMLPYIGDDRVMWAVDYPHTEGSYGVSQSAIEEVLKHTSEQGARRILGDTARSVYNLP